MRQIVFLAFVGFAPTVPVFGQGSLTPPGPPAAIMKSLAQIRSTGIELNDANTPGDGNYHFTISAAGSYFLSRNLDVTKPNGIRVTVPGVTIDLNGFRISRSSGTGGDGITILQTADGCTVQNGSIRGFQFGINSRVNDVIRFVRGGSFLRLAVSECVTGLQTGDSWQVEHCTVHDNAGTGISSLNNSRVSHCIAQDNEGTGIIGGISSIIRNCTARSNAVGGIIAGFGSLLVDCVASGNSTPNGAGAAIEAGPNSTLTNCVAEANNMVYGIQAGSGSTLTNCTAANNELVSSIIGPEGGAGISAGSNSIVRACTAKKNERHGIEVFDRSQIIGCTVSENGGALRPSGISGGLSTLIKDCVVSQSFGDGITLGSNAVVQHCTVSQNQGNGIVVADAGLISDCAVYQNGKRSSPNNTASDGIELGARNRVLNCTIFSNAQHGIHSTSGNNRNYIEGCLLHQNTGFAIALQGNGNTVIKNQVGGNSGGGINQSGGNIAPVQNASDAVGSIHPLANFQ